MHHTVSLPAKCKYDVKRASCHGSDTPTGDKQTRLIYRCSVAFASYYSLANGLKITIIIMVLCFDADCNHQAIRDGCSMFRFPKDEVQLKKWVT